MIHIVKATTADLKTITEIAHKTWPLTYGEILSEAQLSYMLETFYSDAALLKNIESGHQFILAKEENTVLGFASFEHHYQNKNSTKIHKIYILPETQGKGIGKLLIDAIEKLAVENESESLLLNVNRFNKALTFYQKLGFKIIEEIDIELDHGYLMEDYIMEKGI
ncbi:Ribosomal protein S18 acetylase RimI [Flavobacterium glycines]|uniref:Acetyltransferase n=1 Tax=Flavobacterium glycines TaxID=551990 RepID=A0A1B9DJD9_9FLAO|nr:GNAT family N-acetyltransferase [Flavobacterium glycines]OCB69815.1 acetyltransferase [Flavobacterium glycines]GEL12074.1 N-acetyltransferase [Flavobacterium glycines]SDJ89894.1 Ribosomal protein S18 acetylase RimI [Flavobacterium glycines]